jgi:hypothetical protein
MFYAIYKGEQMFPFIHWQPKGNSSTNAPQLLLYPFISHLHKYYGIEGQEFPATKSILTLLPPQDQVQNPRLTKFYTHCRVYLTAQVKEATARGTTFHKSAFWIC